MSDLMFEWDPAKAESNLRKHGVSFEEAASVFTRSAFRTAYDYAHSDTEDRWKAVGLSEELRLLAVIYTRRGNAVRIISARMATNRERREYAETQDQG